MKANAHPCISVQADPETAENLSYDLYDFGAEAIEWRDQSTMTKSSSQKSEFIAGFPSLELRQRALIVLQGMQLEDVSIKAVDVTDDGWSTRWREFFTPVCLNRIQIITPWMEPPKRDLIPITIDPGQAFGTGGHATTKLVLRLLEAWPEKPNWPGTILDVGTGSGVLAVAAVKLGASSVTGIDVDPEAVAAAKENAQANGVGEFITFRHCEATNLKDTFDLVLANIELRAFKQCAASIAALVSQGGSLILSGILESQVEEALTLWPGFEVDHSLREDGWTALELSRRQ